MNHNLPEPGDMQRTPDKTKDTAPKRVYIAGLMSNGGKITGYELEVNLQRFHGAADGLRISGYDVENPAETEDTDPPRTWREWMESGIRQLLTCDAIFLLPRWSESKGARLEYEIARSLGMKIMGAVKE